MAVTQSTCNTGSRCKIVSCIEEPRMPLSESGQIVGKPTVDCTTSNTLYDQARLLPK